METSLTISDQSAINQLPEQLRKYALAKDGKIVSKMPLKDAITSIYDTLCKVLVDTGNGTMQKQDNIESVLITISESVYQLVCDKYKAITINEFKLACLNGSLGDYGQYFGLNLKTVSDWLKGYNNDENKKKAMAEWNRLIGLVSIQEKTPEQKDAIIVDGLIHFFERYKKYGKIKDEKTGNTQVLLIPVNSLCAVFYDNLKEKGLLVITKERKLEMYDKALAEYKADLEAKAKDRTVNFKTEQIKPLLESIAGNNNKPFANICKRMALLQYFDELIEMDTDIKDVLNK